jgi:hypothetical protein
MERDGLAENSDGVVACVYKSFDCFEGTSYEGSM